MSFLYAGYAGAAVAVCAIGAGMKSFRTVPPGHVGFKNLFGKIYEKEYGSGYKIIY